MEGSFQRPSEATNHLSRRHPRENSIRAFPAGRPRTLFGRKHDHPQPLYVRPGRLGDHRRTRSRRLSQGAVGGGPGGLVLPRELRDVLPVQHRQAAVLPQHDLLHHLLRGIHDLEGGPISTKFRILCRWNRASFSRTSWIACAYSMKRRSTPIPRSQSSASITRAF